MAREWLERDDLSVFVVAGAPKGFNRRLKTFLQKELGNGAESLRVNDDLAEWATFKKRDTEISTERPLSLSIEFARANQTHWINFLNKMELQNDQIADFQTVVKKIWIFIEHPIQASTHKVKSSNNWLPRKGWKQIQT